MESKQSKRKATINVEFVQKVWRLMKPFHTHMYQILVITAVFQTVRMGGPYLFGKILDLLVKAQGVITLETALWVLGGLAGVRVISLIIDYITDYVIIQLLIKTESLISTKSFSKLLELSLDYHERVNTGTKINIVNKGVDKLVNLVESFTFEFQPVVLQLIVTAVLILVTSWMVGVTFILSLIPFIYFTFKIYQSTRELRAKRHDAYDESSDEIGDTITNITVVKAFAQERREDKSFSGIWSFIKNVSTIEVNKHIISGFSRGMLVELFYMALLLIGLFEIKNGNITVGSLVFLITLIERAYSNIYRLGRIYERVVDATESVDRLTNIFSQTPTVKNLDNAKNIKSIDGKISFKHVSFAYNKKRVLKNVSFTIPSGSFTAFVGKSGSGKSTVAKLLSRYYDPTKGLIVIDDKYDLKEIDLDSYRKHTAVVFQDSPVPNRKIWEVIAYSAGKKSFSSIKAKVEKAAKLAHAHEFILELDEGYQTLIGERGVKLSGGQRQRLAIARALYAEPKILIMDEPTSHLDTLSESLIQKALDEISKQRSMTKIIIAHRLSTVQHADQILVMERGKLVERGNHAQLMKKNGTYAQIVHQSELKA